MNGIHFSRRSNYDFPDGRKRQTKNIHEYFVIAYSAN
jgi:hypothetical protein